MTADACFALLRPGPGSCGTQAFQPTRSLGLFALTMVAMIQASVAHAVATPFSQTGVGLANLATEVTYNVDFSTLPLRPNLIVQTVPDAAHANMSLQITITNCNLDYPSDFVNCENLGVLPLVSTPRVGVQSLIFKPAECGGLDITPPAYTGKSCDVKIKALNFGTAGAPATFDVTIRGETFVPTSTISLSVTNASPITSDFVETTTSQFFDEGQNFRWIYDTDGDRRVTTPLPGQCQFEPVPNFQIFMPFTYQFQGSASYQGLDCCTWQIDSRTGVTGAGQAIFYVNVDPNDPAYQPTDTDTDGIKNVCDNCPAVPNGPLLGSCTSGTKVQKLCRSNQDCPGGACSQAQDDVNRDRTGNACVPEPGLGSMLAAGLGALAWRARRRARLCDVVDRER